MSKLSSAALLLFFSFALSLHASACDAPASVCATSKSGSLALIKNGQPATILVEDSANPAVLHVANSFASDLERVSGKPASLIKDARDATGARSISVCISANLLAR